MSRTLKVASGSIAVGILVLGLKYLAFVLTGSVALYSDALESIINVATAIGAVIAIHVAEKPADAGHPYGHFKAEYVSAVVEGVLVVLAALSILREAYLGWLHPAAIATPFTGLLINGLATVINACWGIFVIQRGRVWRSPALVADGRHLLTDLYTSIGVIAGIFMVAATGWLVLDSVIAGLVAVNIIWSGFSMIRDSLGGLMDEAVPKETLRRIESVIREQAASTALQAHDLRTRQAGPMTYLDFHLVVPAYMTVARAHAVCDAIEQALHEDLESCVVSIHVEPEENAHEHARLTF
ncbi:cation diffusion facilitator family transporter [Arboricoccus pini]|uniref:Cation diffusion facilitator family transporter n=1 Tax=Arboricoccus pini TaxID=1963835 RepID=A0A212RSU7_9PROT|nr:cation diffusion facilitator family transporter [Arboricoccus pini]SNB75738.1 cation diffusion facilitator family transporter [Arboricoccus pini]